MNDNIVTKEQAVAIKEIDGQITMSSLRIAEITGKAHPKVTADCETMFEALNLDDGDFSLTYKYGNNNSAIFYLLPEREFQILVSGYSIAHRAELIDELLSYRKKEVKVLTPLQHMEKAYQLEAESHEKTQKLLEVEKVMTRVLEQEIDAISDLDGLIDIRSFALLVTSKTNGVDLGRTKIYMILRECGLVGDDTRATQRGVNLYLENKLVEGVNKKMYPKTYVVAAKFDQLLTLMIRKLGENKELNKKLNYPFGKGEREE